MSVSARGVSRITKQKDSVFWDSNLGSRLESNGQKGLLRNDGLCASILHLVSKLGSCVCRVGGAGDTAGPDAAKVDNGYIDIVRGENAENVALFPAKQMFEALAELDAALLDLAKAVGAGGVGIYKDCCEGQLA